MKRANITTETYEMGMEDFMVDVVTGYRDGAEIRQVWLYRRSRGAKIVCFSDAGAISRAEFMNCVEGIPDDFYEAYDRTLATCRRVIERKGEITWI